MKYELAFTYIFKDPQWVRKFLIGVAFYFGSIFIVPLFFVMGYNLRIVREVSQGKQGELPEWDRFSELFLSGLTLFAIFFVYFLPVIIWFLALFLTAIMAALFKPAEEVLAPLFFVLILGGQILVIIWSLIIAVISPVLVMRYAATGQFISAFQFGNMYRFIRAIPGPYFLVVLLAYALNVAAGFGWLLFLIGILFTLFYSRLVTSHLEGQLYRIFLQGSEAL